MKFSLLSATMSAEDYALNVLKAYGKDVDLTDLAYILGAKKNTFWTKNLDNQKRIYVVEEGSLKSDARYDNLTRGVRPAIYPSEKLLLAPVLSDSPGGVKFAEYGVYPQTLADAQISSHLEALYEGDVIHKTGKTYTFNNYGGVYTCNFNPVPFPEFEYNHKKYIRIKSFQSAITTNGLKIQEYSPYWVEVLPVKWLVDPSGFWISEKILFAGIPFSTKPEPIVNVKHPDEFDFTQVIMYEYLNNCFAADIIDQNANDKAKNFEKSIISQSSGVTDLLEKLKIMRERIVSGEKVSTEEFEKLKQEYEKFKQFTKENINSTGGIKLNLDTQTLDTKNDKNTDMFADIDKMFNDLLNGNLPGGVKTMEDEIDKLSKQMAKARTDMQSNASSFPFSNGFPFPFAPNNPAGNSNNSNSNKSIFGPDSKTSKSSCATKPTQPDDEMDGIPNKPASPDRQYKYGISTSNKAMPIKDQIDFFVKNGISFMLHGPSGVGKTQRVKAVDPNLTSITLCNGILPEDVIGRIIYPNGFVQQDGSLSGVFVEPKWYNDLCKKCKAEPDKNHVLFIDEITNARETTQSLIYHIVLEKSIAPGLGKLPDNSVVVLAGNNKEDSGAAFNMPAPLFRRLSHIYLDLNIYDWMVWGSELKNHDQNRLNIHPLVSGFVATYGERVFYSEYDEENPPTFALDPRKWEKVSDKIYANHGVIRSELLQTDIGPEVAKYFMAFAKNPPLSLQEVLDDNYSEADIPESYDAKLALTLNLRHVQSKDMPKVRKFIEQKLGPEHRAIFDSVWIANDDIKAMQIAGLANERVR